MKKTLIFLFCILPLTISGQVTEYDFTAEIKDYDISDLLTVNTTKPIKDSLVFDRPEPLGYIGEKYQRFFIHFISVIKNPNNKLQYLVYGKTKVRSNVCDFQGLITIEKCITYYDVDFPNIKQGSIKGKYQFFEDPDQKSTGLLFGIFTSGFYLSPTNEIEYNDLRMDDSFHNNLFEGVWNMYNSLVKSKCNWGDYRIPDSEDLDSGAGEFVPNPEFEKFGWENYLIMVGIKKGNISREMASRKENEKWWIDSKNNCRVGKGDFHPQTSHRTVLEPLDSYGSS